MTLHVQISEAKSIFIITIYALNRSYHSTCTFRDITIHHDFALIRRINMHISCKSEIIKRRYHGWRDSMTGDQRYRLKSFNLRSFQLFYCHFSLVRLPKRTLHFALTMIAKLERSVVAWTIRTLSVLNCLQSSITETLIGLEFRPQQLHLKQLLPWYSSYDKSYSVLNVSNSFNDNKSIFNNFFFIIIRSVRNPNSGSSFVIQRS